MKTVLLYSLLIFLMLGTSSSIIAQGWAQLEDFPSTPRDDGTSFTINSITYCGTGLNSTWNPTSDFYALDMNTDSWSPITGIPTNEARQYAVGFASSNHGFLFGGLNGNGYLNDLWTYDPTTDIWTTATPMPSAGRSGASCFVIGDTAYILGGQTSTTASISEVWAYSMSADSWTQKNALPDSLWRASSISYQNKGYVLFGRKNSLEYKNNFYEYSPLTDSWTSISNFPGVGRTYAGIAILNNNIVSIAGRDSIGNSYNDMWEYSTATDTWSLSVNLPSAQRRGGTCFYSGTVLYYTTGIDLNDTRLTETWKFDLFLSTNELDNEVISTYPNPAKDILKIGSSISTGMFHYEISSIHGMIVKSGESDFEEAINIDQLELGNYLIHIKTESKTFTKKLMVY
jgi:N-acetylneuraminic acid mutarotase